MYGQTLNQRLVEVINSLEKQFNVSLSVEARTKLLHDKVVGYSANNTFDKVVLQIHKEFQEVISYKKVA
jgi:hypothetical protein